MKHPKSNCQTWISSSFCISIALSVLYISWKLCNLGQYVVSQASCHHMYRPLYRLPLGCLDGNQHNLLWSKMWRQNGLYAFSHFDSCLSAFLPFYHTNLLMVHFAHKCVPGSFIHQASNEMIFCLLFRIWINFHYTMHWFEVWNHMRIFAIFRLWTFQPLTKSSFIECDTFCDHQKYVHWLSTRLFF